MAPSEGALVAAAEDASLARIRANLERLVGAGVLDGAILGLGDVSGDLRVVQAGTGTVAGQRVDLVPEHRFLLTSVTKTFTATQVLLLAESGALDLDSPVAAYLPGFERHGKGEVTTRQLLTHTAGLSDVANLIEGPSTDATARDCIDAALGTWLAFEPGEGWAYGSPGFWAMAELVSRVRGVDYELDLEQEITAPLALSDTRYETADAPPERYVEAQTEGTWDAHLPEQVRKVAYPAGGLVSTAPDLVRFGQSFLAGSPLSGTVLGSASTAHLFQQHAHGWNMGRRVAWSLGWETPGPGNLQSERTIFHHGASGTGLWVDPDHGLVVALVTARWWLPYRFYAEILNGVLGALAR